MAFHCAYGSVNALVSVRCLLQNPILVKQGQVLTGRVLMVANMKQSYDVTIECKIMGTSTQSQNTLDLKNPYFRYTGVQPQPPPGENSGSPSEAYWAQMDMAGARQVCLKTGLCTKIGIIKEPCFEP